MERLNLRLMLAIAGFLALAAWAVIPRGIEAARLFAVADEPEKLADLALEHRFDARIARREIEAALQVDDADLAQSLLALADERAVAVDADLRGRVETANRAAAVAVRATGRFIDGFIVGQPDDLAGLAGTVTGDLFVFGDVRDVVRETSHLARGEKADELILGLACVGLAVTAGTYATLGAGAPARVGISLVKAAGKTGRLSAKLTASVVLPLRAVVDTAALKRLLGPHALLRPVAAVRGVREAVKLEKAQGLMRVLGDVGSIQAKAGTRATLEGLRFANGPKDVARLARLADAKGGKTRAVLKILGRGAIALTVGLFELASWMWWAIMSLLGLAAALKRLTERTTLRMIHWRKLSRARRLAATAQPA